MNELWFSWHISSYNRRWRPPFGFLPSHRTQHVERNVSSVVLTTTGYFLRNNLAYALWDGFPVTPLHSLVIPRRHAADYFSLTTAELLACDDLLRKASEALKLSDASIEGFNIGVNAGAVAGQTIYHCHFHLIPRRMGDVENPQGGVRHIIPGKGAY